MTLLKRLTILVVTTLMLGAAHAAPDFSTTAKTNAGGARWRIGYYEGGPHGNYYEYLSAVVAGLMELGWIEQEKLPRYDDLSTERLWVWLSTKARSKYIEFVADGYYSANWDSDRRQRLRREVIDRARNRNDLDLIFALGTWAGKDLANNEHSVPTIVMSASDPVQSGIITSNDDSGFDHVLARVDPHRYERQLKVFHDIIGFHKLGVAYENSPDGRSYAAMDTVEKVAAERGFEVVSCHTESDIADRTRASQSVVACFEKLVTEVDAIYVTNQGGVNADSIPELVRIANRNRVPTFAQPGSRQVEYGFLLSISRPSFKPVGMFLAATVAKVLNGARPRDLRQVYEESPNIAINLKTAEVIGLYLYADVLAAADEIFREIKRP